MSNRYEYTRVSGKANSGKVDALVEKAVEFGLGGHPAVIISEDGTLHQINNRILKVLASKSDTAGKVYEFHKLVNLEIFIASTGGDTAKTLLDRERCVVFLDSPRPRLADLYIRICAIRDHTLFVTNETPRTAPDGVQICEVIVDLHEITEEV